MSPRKPSRTTLTRQLDTVFSLVIRSKGECEMCGSGSYLQCAHVVTRANRRLRWDEANACCLCAKCHFQAHAHPLAFSKWFEDTRPDDHEYVLLNAPRVANWTDAELLEHLTALRARLAGFQERDAA